MKTLESKKLRNAINNKINELSFRWFMEKNNIFEMSCITKRLRGFTAEQIVIMTNHDEFCYEDKFFRYENADKLVSLTSNEIEKIIEETVTDEDLEEIESYIIEKILGT